MPTLVLGAAKADLRLPEGQKGASQKPPDTDLVGLICVIFSALSSWDWKTIGDAMCEDIEWNYAASGVNAGEAPLFGTKQGRKATLKHLQRIQKLLDVKEAKMDWDHVSVYGHRVSCQGFEKALVRATGKTYETDLGYIFFFEENKMSKVYIYAKDAKGINEAFTKAASGWSGV
ncbi:hypothetical protein KFL_001650090 [Klebsormidium nitens]|uniref:SnoaL-like domain-containing protein n=1 Tax=Klebsormidium nitens TaxID=105231 RepID=A0A1Y1I574_KLENI|nr:hypothetical protein KFL_001650090 [Klebsormidium nitens]|eukprot:GAQ83856.1 hypothetical protein KFL_001650090 [Klebsormidium nitens]